MQLQFLNLNDFNCKRKQVVPHLVLLVNPVIQFIMQVKLWEYLQLLGLSWVSGWNFMEKAPMSDMPLTFVFGVNGFGRVFFCIWF